MVRPVSASGFGLQAAVTSGFAQHPRRPEHRHGWTHRAALRLALNLSPASPANHCSGGQWLGMTDSQDRLYAMTQEYGIKVRRVG